GRKSPPSGLVQRLLAVAVAVGDKETLRRGLGAIPAMKEGRFPALAGMLDALERRKLKPADLGDAELPARLDRLFEQARRTAADEKAKESDRLGALTLLGRRDGDLETLRGLLSPRSSPRVQSAALAAAGRLPGAGVAAAVLAGWNGYSPELRARALDVLMGRPAWLDQLLTALEKKEVLSAQL